MPVSGKGQISHVNNKSTGGGGNRALSFLLKWAPALIIIVTAAIYFKAVFFDFTNFDDDVFILNNELVKDIGWNGLKAIFTEFNAGKYQPLTSFSFAIEYHFFGFNSTVFHLNNILLHLVSTLLVFKVVEKLSSERLTAAVVAVLFAIHPMHVEEVAWASERKDMLYAVFYLSALYYYVKYLDSGYRRGYIFLVFGLFLASLFSKSEAVTLPLVLLLFDVYRKRKINVSVVLEKLPFLALSVFFVVLGIMSQHSEGGLGQVSIASFGMINRIFLFTTLPAFYIVRLFAPFRLSAMHYYPDLQGGLLPWPYYVSLPFMILVVWLVFRKSEMRRDMVFGVLFFAVTIFIMPQLVTVGPSLTPERYTYIPYIGFFFVAGKWLSKQVNAGYGKVAFGLFGGFFVLFGIQTWLRLDAWKDSNSLLTDTIEKNADIADCSYFFWLRGNVRIGAGDLQGALQDYSTAISQHPGYLDAYCNRAAAYFQSGDPGSAVLDYDKALRISPHHSKSYYNRASAKATLGDYHGAYADYNTYLNMVPQDDRAITDRGMVRFSLGDTSGAIGDWKRSAQLGNRDASQLLQQIGQLP